jgi:hypothetical protein
MDPSIWADSHVADWVRRNPKNVSTVEPAALLGEVDADTEWNSDIKPVQLFVHTPTYENVKRVDLLYLFGRRGTGKTAVFRMLQHEAREGLLHDIAFCWIVQSDKIKEKLIDLLGSDVLGALTPAGLMNLSRLLWAWFFRVSSMLSVVHSDPRAEWHHSDLQTLRTFLKFTKLEGLPERGLLTAAVADRAASHLREALRKARTAQEVSSLLADELNAADYLEADIALDRLLSHTRGYSLVAVDAGEVYDVRDPATLALMDGLIDAVRVSYQNRALARVVGKAAFPSEVRDYLHPQNHEKFQSHATVISWQHHDLVQFIAKRYQQYLGDRSNDQRSITIDSINEAEEWLYSSLPRRINTRCDFGVDTLAYIVRHTQKKPRQLLHLFNAILTLADAEKVQPAMLYKHPDLIVRGVQLGLGDLIDGILGVYEMIIPDAPRLFKAVISNVESWWAGKELGQLLRRASGIRGNIMSTDELRDLLFEAGLVGRARRIAKVGEDRNGRPTFVMTAAFQYQVRSVAPPSLEDVFVIHPMLYEGFEVYVDKRVYVIPEPLEEAERAAIRRLGLTLSDD